MALRLRKIAFSFIIDEEPRFAYQGWHLAHSIVEQLNARPEDIFVQFTTGVDSQTIEMFKKFGCRTIFIERFGDGKYCNKIAQWSDGLINSEFQLFVFLDTDMIFVGNSLGHLPYDVICAKVVDLANPPIDILEEIFCAAGFDTFPAKCNVEASDGKTYVANSNGGIYSVPKTFANTLFSSWKKWAIWLLRNSEPLSRINKEAHIDQVSFCLAIHETGLPFQFIPSNLNYFVHFAGHHSCYDSEKPISLLHYHNDSINVVGLLEPAGAVAPLEIEAIRQANSQIARHFTNKLFWEMRYAHFSERGSGIGSRGKNLEYKRQLLREQGAEQARSVLDVGCGDLEVVKALELHGYVGVDQSTKSVENAKFTRPDWTFLRGPCPQASPADLVLCFEVLIHQESPLAYHALIRYLAEKTQRVLIVSGYEEESEAIRNNAMLFFYEPLSVSLRNTGKFKSVEVIGRHTDVTIFRCEVADGLGYLFRRMLHGRTAARPAVFERRPERARVPRNTKLQTFLDPKSW